MSLFDYKRNVPDEDLTKMTDSKKNMTYVVGKSHEVETIPVVAVESCVVLSQIPMKFVSVAARDGYSKLDLLDNESDTGFGSLYVPSKHVSVSKKDNGDALLGYCDITIPSDVKDNLPYLLMKDGSVVKATISVDKVQDVLKKQSIQQFEEHRADLLNRAMQSSIDVTSEYKDI